MMVTPSDIIGCSASSGDFTGENVVYGDYSSYAYEIGNSAGAIIPQPERVSVDAYYKDYDIVSNLLCPYIDPKVVVLGPVGYLDRNSFYNNTSNYTLNINGEEVSFEFISRVSLEPVDVCLGVDSASDGVLETYYEKVIIGPTWDSEGNLMPAPYALNPAYVVMEDPMVRKYFIPEDILKDNFSIEDYPPTLNVLYVYQFTIKYKGVIGYSDVYKVGDAIVGIIDIGLSGEYFVSGAVFARKFYFNEDGEIAIKNCGYGVYTNSWYYTLLI